MKQPSFAAINVDTDSYESGETHSWSMAFLHPLLAERATFNHGHGRAAALLAGDREIFYPDCKLLAESLKRKTNVKFVVGHGLWHIYPMYYFLPEGRKCRKIIADFIS